MTSTSREGPVLRRVGLTALKTLQAYGGTLLDLRAAASGGGDVWPGAIAVDPEAAPQTITALVPDRHQLLLLLSDGEGFTRRAAALLQGLGYQELVWIEAAEHPAPVDAMAA